MPMSLADARFLIDARRAHPPRHRRLHTRGGCQLAAGQAAVPRVPASSARGCYFPVEAAFRRVRRAAQQCACQDKPRASIVIRCSTSSDTRSTACAPSRALRRRPLWRSSSSTTDIRMQMFPHCAGPRAALPPPRQQRRLHRQPATTGGACRCEYLVFLNNDTVPQPVGWMSCCDIEEHPEQA